MWPLLGVTIVVVAIAAISLGDGTPPLFTENLREEAVVLSRKAVTFQDMLSRMSSVDRVELTGVTEEARSSLGDTVEYFDGLVSPPSEAVAAVTAFHLAADSWLKGVNAFEDAMLEAADSVVGLGQEDRVLNALLDLRAGDRLYLLAVEELTSADITQPVSGMPDVRFLPDPYPIAPAAQTLVALAQSDESLLELRPDLAITAVTTEPEWVRDVEGSLVVDATDSVIVKVVVTNSGNARSDPIDLAVDLVGGDGLAQAFTATVEELASGATTTVSFPDVVVLPGTTYQLTARLGFAGGDVETSDNARILRFRVNEETPPSTEGESG